MKVLDLEIPEYELIDSNIVEIIKKDKIILKDYVHLTKKAKEPKLPMFNFVTDFKEGYLLDEPGLFPLQNYDVKNLAIKLAKNEITEFFAIIYCLTNLLNQSILKNRSIFLYIRILEHLSLFSYNKQSQMLFYFDKNESLFDQINDVLYNEITYFYQYTIPIKYEEKIYAKFYAYYRKKVEELRYAKNLYRRT